MVCRYFLDLFCKEDLWISLKYSVDLEPSSKLKSVTQEKDLDEFLNTAELAGIEFTAGKPTYNTSCSKSKTLILLRATKC